MRKGVSPLIAVVVIVVIAITVGTTLSMWASNWAGTQISPEGITCGPKLKYNVDSAKFNSSGRNLLIVRVTNVGDVGAYGFGLHLDNDTVTKYYNSTHDNISTSPSVSSADPLSSGETAYITLTVTQGLGVSETLSTYDQTFLTSLTGVSVTNLGCPPYSVRGVVVQQF